MMHHTIHGHVRTEQWAVRLRLQIFLGIEQHVAMLSMIAVLLRTAKAGLHLSLIRRPDLLIIECQPLAMNLDVGYVVACRKGG